MWEQALFESSHHSDRRSSMLLLASAVAQLAIVLTAVLVSLSRVAALPAIFPAMAPVVALVTPPAPPAPVRPLTPRTAALPAPGRRLLTYSPPSPAPAALRRNQAAPVAAALPSGPLAPAGIATASLAFAPTEVAPPPLPPSAARSGAASPLSVGGDVQAARCLYCPTPLYPAFARLAHLQGSVILLALISPSGAVEQLQRVAGNPVLAAAAEATVRSWRYRPTVLDGHTVPVTCTITVRFTLDP